MVNNLKIKILTAEDLGMTQDEYNNMLIDWWELMEQVKKENIKTDEQKINKEGFPKSITITISNKNKTNYLDLWEQSN